jgi:hypothetical protein
VPSNLSIRFTRLLLPGVPPESLECVLDTDVHHHLFRIIYHFFYGCAALSSGAWIADQAPLHFAEKHLLPGNVDEG